MVEFPSWLVDAWLDLEWLFFGRMDGDMGGFPSWLVDAWLETDLLFLD